MHCIIAQIVFQAGTKDSLGNVIYKNRADEIVRTISSGLKSSPPLPFSNSFVGIFYYNYKSFPEFGDDIIYDVKYDFNGQKECEYCMLYNKFSEFTLIKKITKPFPCIVK